MEMEAEAEAEAGKILAGLDDRVDEFLHSC